MAKKQVSVSLRKPPAADVEIPSRSGELREVTLLLPVELARKLAVRCVEGDRDTSAFVADAILRALANEPDARDVVTITVSGSAWARVRSRLAELTSWLPIGLFRPRAA